MIGRDWHVGGGQHKYLYHVIRMVDSERMRWWEYAYTVCWLFPILPNRLHYTSFLILNISHPVCLACCDEHVRGPSTDVTVQLIIFFDLEA